MKINKKLNDAINAQIGEELLASNGYAMMASYFDSLGLSRLTAMFFDQSAEEREHAMKFLHYVLEVEGDVVIPEIPAAPSQFESVESAFKMALSWEKDVTEKINNLMVLALAEKDYATQDFLRWFITEQVEEEATMSHLVTLAETLGDRSILNLEAHLPQK
jgi:ferritin